jgi:hypothetical protein
MRLATHVSDSQVIELPNSIIYHIHLAYINEATRRRITQVSYQCKITLVHLESFHHQKKKKKELNISIIIEIQYGVLDDRTTRFHIRSLRYIKLPFS